MKNFISYLKGVLQELANDGFGPFLTIVVCILTLVGLAVTALLWLIEFVPGLVVAIIVFVALVYALYRFVKRL